MIKKNNLYLFCFLVFIIFVALTIIFYYSYSIYEIRIMDVDYNVDNEIGINVDVDGLHFGTLLPGGASVRTIKFDAFKDTRVIFIFENIDYVYPSENDFFMNEGDSKNIDFKAAIPLSLDHGKYKGTLKIIFKRA